MLRTLALTSLLSIVALSSPASALTKEQKMETCTFGADNQKLTGSKRTAFMNKCMSDKDDKRGPAAKPASAPAPKQ